MFSDGPWGMGEWSARHVRFALACVASSPSGCRSTVSPDDPGGGSMRSQTVQLWIQRGLGLAVIAALTGCSVKVSKPVYRDRGPSAATAPHTYNAPSAPAFAPAAPQVYTPPTRNGVPQAVPVVPPYGEPQPLPPSLQSVPQPYDEIELPPPPTPTPSTTEVKKRPTWNPASWFKTSTTR